ncbi:succinate dehydrogenase/fumarate reductase iron-sulfur subunit [Actinomadura madurae]|uniref:succinate dehydrogenase/fumarate reductase iron-sulfur subunit n=1 Tax=Actinomadura madurae TaxID=1993 RepID=UPI002026E78E|nr:2Fe-2S iron-sulfur cluster-binding protein [Actinomadura madurae]MCP9951354.1 2Fe-2S iron-sulfur cluster-binding protein [Actinomadura madurae]MCP9968128.1 2Fe-2S iron-sulfur cluster-binding protein [Actinomadura madurae]MCP9980587.1 2Fe-2S iron-sulfur cluster-binding protein [Actinomadura madurae]MCQ0016789.1 2Fe-2S iron-sulfur cluster-binding protein [Actinomadura madurae]URM96872.1 2Fe-2S iron-sulfur cluster-binding protein [Actinomadura madurae]
MTLLVRVARTDPGAPAEFRVETFHPMTVLDVLLAIQREHEPSLGFRFSCRVAMCGTCTLRVDGRSALACQTVLPEDATRIRLDPAAGFPVVRDLITDTTPFWEQWARITPYVVPDEDAVGGDPAVIPPDSPERRAIDPALDCIQCGACFSSCGIAGRPRTFLGPAALNRALVLIQDSRDTATRQRRELVAGADGVDRCHYIYGCTGSCPKGLDPARSIRRLRKGGGRDDG